MFTAAVIHNSPQLETVGSRKDSCSQNAPSAPSTWSGNQTEGSNWKTQLTAPFICRYTIGWDTKYTQLFQTVLMPVTGQWEGYWNHLEMRSTSCTPLDTVAGKRHVRSMNLLPRPDSPVGHSEVARRKHPEASPLHIMGLTTQIKWPYPGVQLYPQLYNITNSQAPK